MNWSEFASNMLDKDWVRDNPPWPIGRIPRDKEEAERRFWPWPLDEDDYRRLTQELEEEKTEPMY